VSETISFGGLEIEPRQTSKKGQDPFHYQKLAARFIHESGEIYRYLNGRVLRYAGTHYVEENDLTIKLRRFLVDSGIPHNNNVVGNVVPFITTTTYIDPSQHAELPFFLGDAPAEPRNVITFKNGLLDVMKAVQGDHQLTFHTSNWINTNCLPYEYDHNAKCPLWDDFLGQTLEDDPERIALLQEFAGYLLLPDPTRQKMLALLGVSRGGKGVTQKVLQALLGRGNWTAYDLTSLGERFGKVSLVDRLAAFVGEVNLQKHPDKYRIFQTLNSITGCDATEVEWKNVGTKLSAVLPVRFVIACNEFPNFADPSGALTERTLVINYRRAIPEGQRDPHLADKLYAELPGICNWAIEGLVRITKTDKWTVPTVAKETVNKIRRNASPVVAFLQDRVKVSTSLDTGNLHGIEVVEADDLWVYKHHLVEAYAEWVVNHDGPAPNTNYLRADVETILPSIQETKRMGTTNVRMRGFAGIALKREVVNL
jgi:P4 family phage/plasmid primase-like protien